MSNAALDTGFSRNGSYSANTNSQRREPLSTGNRFEQPSILIWLKRSQVTPTNLRLSAEKCEQAHEVQSISDRVKTVDKTLALPRKLLAEILGVSRTTLYDVLNGIDRDYRNEQRLKNIEEAILVISEQTKYPIGQSAKLLRLDGVSLADELKKTEINFDTVKKLSQLIHKRKESVRQRDSSEDAQLEQYLHTQTAG